MEPIEVKEDLQRTSARTNVVTQGAGGGCSCAPSDNSATDSSSEGTVDTSFVYVLGRVEARFSSVGLEKEFAQALGRSETAGLTDRQSLHKVLSQPQHRYLARQVCWIVTVEGLETYIVQPRDPEELNMLIEALRPTPHVTDVDVLIGIRGPIAPPSMCNGLQVPILAVDQIYSFDVDALLKSIPRPEKIAAAEFHRASEELFQRLMQMADNAGATDEHRALNYLAVRYPAVYVKVAEAFGRNMAISSVEVRPSRLTGIRRIVDVIFTFTDRTTDVPEKYFVRVDITEEFPFLVTKLSPFYER